MIIVIKRHKSFDISISSRILKALPPNRPLLWGRFFEFTHKFILFSCFLRLHYFLIFLSFFFSCVIFKLIECKKNLVPYCTFSLTFSLIFKNWNSLHLALWLRLKNEKKSHCRTVKPSFLLPHFFKAVKAHCVDLFKWKKSQQRRDFTFIVIIFS